MRRRRRPVRAMLNVGGWMVKGGGSSVILSEAKDLGGFIARRSMRWPSAGHVILSEAKDLVCPTTVEAIARRGVARGQEGNVARAPVLRLHPREPLARPLHRRDERPGAPHPRAPRGNRRLHVEVPSAPLGV